MSTPAVDDAARVAVLDLGEPVATGAEALWAERLVVVDRTAALGAHRHRWVDVGADRRIGRILGVVVGELPFTPPEGLTADRRPLLWAGDGDGVVWGLTTDRIGPGDGGLADLLRVLRIPEVFDRVSEIVCALPFAVACPGLLLACSAVSGAELCAAARAALLRLRGAGLPDPGPAGFLAELRAAGAPAGPAARGPDGTVPGLSRSAAEIVSEIDRIAEQARRDLRPLLGGAQATERVRAGLADCAQRVAELHTAVATMIDLLHAGLLYPVRVPDAVRAGAPEPYPARDADVAAAVRETVDRWIADGAVTAVRGELERAARLVIAQGCHDVREELVRRRPPAIDAAPARRDAPEAARRLREHVVHLAGLLRSVVTERWLPAPRLVVLSDHLAHAASALAAIDELLGRAAGADAGTVTADETAPELVAVVADDLVALVRTALRTRWDTLGAGPDPVVRAAGSLLDAYRLHLDTHGVLVAPPFADGTSQAGRALVTERWRLHQDVRSVATTAADGPVTQLCRHDQLDSLSTGRGPDIPVIRFVPAVLDDGWPDDGRTGPPLRIHSTGIAGMIRLLPLRPGRLGDPQDGDGPGTGDTW